MRPVRHSLISWLAALGGTLGAPVASATIAAVSVAVSWTLLDIGACQKRFMSPTTALLATVATLLLTAVAALLAAVPAALLAAVSTTLLTAVAATTSRTVSCFQAINTSCNEPYPPPRGLL